MAYVDLTDEDEAASQLPAPQHPPPPNQSSSESDAELSEEDEGPASQQLRPQNQSSSDADAELSEEEEGDSSQLPAAQQPHPLNQSSSAADAELSDEDEDLLQLQSSASSSYTTIRRPTRHVNTSNKLQDWALTVREQRLIIGDSNLARFPPFQVQDLQIDSYPGATFLHAEAILRKATCSVPVNTVVLAFGLNNRKNRTRATTIKQLQAAVSMAHNRFPEADVLVPLINFSPGLPIQDRESLRTLNNHIQRNFNHLTELPSQDFNTDSDLVHWTRPTAVKMLQHWLKQLN